MATRRARHQVDKRPITLVMAFDQADWLGWRQAAGYTPIEAAGVVLGEPFASANRDDSRAVRIADHIDATHVGQELVETDQFAARDDADALRRWMQRQLRPRLV